MKILRPLSICALAAIFCLDGALAASRIDALPEPLAPSPAALGAAQTSSCSELALAALVRYRRDIARIEPALSPAMANDARTNIELFERSPLASGTRLEVELFREEMVGIRTRLAGLLREWAPSTTTRMADKDAASLGLALTSGGIAYASCALAPRIERVENDAYEAPPTKPTQRAPRKP